MGAQLGNNAVRGSSKGRRGEQIRSIRLTGRRAICKIEGVTDTHDTWAVDSRPGLLGSLFLLVNHA